MDTRFEQIESSQRQHHETIHHSERMNVVNEQSEYNKFTMLRPKLFKDGNSWCVLFGENIQEGIAGFGKTPHLAILGWNKNWHNPVSQALDTVKDNQDVVPVIKEVEVDN